MKKMAIGLGLMMGSSVLLAESLCDGLQDVEMLKLHSREMLNICQTYPEQLLLIVNTASQCGFTPQFKGLETLYQAYKDKGLVIIGFPSDDFDQEFDNAEQTAEVCYLNYGVTFPMLSTSEVTGSSANPFFKKLAELSGQEPQWNFHKYLVRANESEVQVFPSQTTPEALQTTIAEQLP